MLIHIIQTIAKVEETVPIDHVRELHLIVPWDVDIGAFDFIDKWWRHCAASMSKLLEKVVCIHDR
jgi:hypothetical protein